MLGDSPLRVVVRGSGDVGSAVAHRLFVAGFFVVIHDSPRPTATRRGMSFTDAIFDSHSELEGVRAVRIDDEQDLNSRHVSRAVIPITTIPLPQVLEVVRPDALVDARMQKRSRPETQRGLAPLTIGLGPGFVAGDTTHLVVETSWEGYVPHRSSNWRSRPRRRGHRSHRLHGARGTPRRHREGAHPRRCPGDKRNESDRDRSETRWGNRPRHRRAPDAHSNRGS